MNTQPDVSEPVRNAISGQAFNNMYPDIEFVKVTFETEICDDFYSDDLHEINQSVIDQMESFETYIDNPIYFVEKKAAQEQISLYGKHVVICMRKIIIPDDANVFIDFDMFQTDKAYLSEKVKLTQKICLDIVSLNGLTLQHIPDSMKNKYMCMIALRQNGEAIKFIRISYIDRDMCMIAIRQTGKAIMYVPIEMITNEMRVLAFAHNQNDDSYKLTSKPVRDVYIEIFGNNDVTLQSELEKLTYPDEQMLICEEK